MIQGIAGRTPRRSGRLRLPTGVSDRWWSLTGVLALAVSLTGCFGYVPTELGRVEPGDRIRAGVAPGALEEDVEGSGGTDAPLGLVVSGRVLMRGPDTLLLSVPLQARPGSGLAAAGLARHVAIPAPAIRRVDVRVLQRGRTAALVAGAAALLGVVVYQAFIRTDPAGTGDENPPPSDEALRPVWAPR